MSDAFSAEISQRICQHMNEDHDDAIALYAQVFGQVSDVSTAQMLKIDAQGMDLLVQGKESTHPIRILFDHELQDSEDAHHTLIAMVREARQRLQHPS